MTPTPRSSSRPRRTVVALALLVGACGGEQRGLGGNAATEPDVYVARKDDLLVTVQELGEIQALDQTEVRSGVEGRTTILYLVPEGTRVEAGQKLVELDASDLDDRAANQAITVERAKATLVDAQQNVEILEKELQALHATAESRLEVAEIALEKYLGRAPAAIARADATGPRVDALPGASGDEIDEGTNQDVVTALRTLVDGTEYGSLPDAVVELLGEENLERDLGEMANQVLDQIDQIRLARADLKLKEDTLEHSRRLADKDYITRNELDGDQLDFDSQQSRVRLAWNKLDLLVHYGLRSEKINLELEVANARLELSKVQASATARRAREAAELRSRQSEYDLAKGRLDNLHEQIRNAVIHAPNPGLVVYAKVGDGRRSTEVVSEGIEVRERQSLIILPDVSKMIAELKVSEADIDKVVVGQRATLRIDAFPDRDFPGEVSRVSPLPDSGSRWSNNNKKVYKTAVLLDGINELLRPGMSATVTIEIGRLRDVLALPLQAVQRDRAVHYVWKRTDAGPEATIVRPGQVNLTHVEIREGVADGDSIYLSPPSGIEAPEFEQPAASAGEGDDATPPPDPDAVRSAREAAQRQENGEGKQERASGGGGDFWSSVRSKLPQFAERIDAAGDRKMALFRDRELMDAVQAEPTLKQQLDEMRARFRGSRGGGGDRSESR